MNVSYLDEWAKPKYFLSECCTSLSPSSQEISLTLRADDAISIADEFFGISSTDYRAMFNLKDGQLANGIKKVIFNPPATIIIWRTGEKTVVKCKPGEKYDRWTGFAMCLSKYLLGEDFHGVFRKFCDI